MFQESRRVAEILGDQHAVALALYDLGRLASYRGAYDEARGLLLESLELLRRGDTPSSLALTLSSLGLLAYQQGEYAQAKRWLEEGRWAAIESGDRRAIAHTTHVLGLTYLGEGAVEAARRQFERALPIFQELDDQHSTAMTLSNLAGLSAIRGDLETARLQYRASLLVAREAGNQRRQAFTVSTVAALRASQAPARAIRLDGAAVAVCERLGTRLEPALRAQYDAQLAPARLMLGEDEAAAAETAGQAMTLADAVDETLAWLASDDGLDEAESNGEPGEAVDLPGVAAWTTPAGGTAPPTLAGLTRRERDIAILLARGQTTNREIAKALVITEGTAANYVQRVLNRLELRTRAQVAAWSAEHHLHEANPRT